MATDLVGGDCTISGDRSTQKGREGTPCSDEGKGGGENV